MYEFNTPRDLVLDLGSGVGTYVVHHSSTPTYVPNVIEIGRKNIRRSHLNFPSKFKVT